METPSPISTILHCRAFRWCWNGEPAEHLEPLYPIRGRRRELQLQPGLQPGGLFYQVTLLSICFLSKVYQLVHCNQMAQCQSKPWWQDCISPQAPYIFADYTWFYIGIGATAGKADYLDFQNLLWILVDWGQNDNQLFAQVLLCSWSWPTFALAASTSELLACY